MATETKLAVILHTDIVGSTALVQQEERVAHERIQDTFRRFAEIISAFRGTTHELRGDALVAEFARASDAISAALTFQRDNREHNKRLTGTIKPEARIGIAMGEVVVADRTVTGAGVVLAQRLEQLARAGNVCISAATREAVPARLSLAYEDLGEHHLKGFKLAQRAYVVSVTAGVDLPPPDESRWSQRPLTAGVKDDKLPSQCFHSRTSAVIQSRSTSRTVWQRTLPRHCQDSGSSWSLPAAQLLRLKARWSTLRVWRSNWAFVMSSGGAFAEQGAAFE